MNKKISVQLLCILILCCIVGAGVSGAESSIKKLHKPDLTRGILLMQALQDRESIRTFRDQEISDEILSNLLWAACGVNRQNGKRTAPSARNRQEIDVYVALPEGLFKYNPQEHELLLVLDKDIREDVGVQEFTQQAPLNLIYVADLKKMGTPTQEDDFYAAVDTGYISQNVYLFCASEGLATVVIGWIKKEKLHKIMELQDSQKIILAQPVGYPEK